jgi:hypothetical protein
MILEHLEVPESKEYYKRKQTYHNDGAWEPTGRALRGQRWKNVSKKINNVV